MPSNPFKEDQICYKWVDKMLNNIPPEGINLNQLLINCLKLFPVSEKKVMKFIHLNINLNKIKLEEDVLFRVGK